MQESQFAELLGYDKLPFHEQTDSFQSSSLHGYMGKATNW